MTQEALKQALEALQKSGIANSPSDPEICNERSAQACGPVYCGDSGGYCNKCPKQKIIQDMKPCKGMNCGCTDGRSHSLECLAELAAAIAGGVFVKEALAQPEQEPVAWLSTDSIGERYLCFDKPLDNDPVQPLFTTQPQRTWVGLTDEEIDYFIVHRLTIATKNNLAALIRICEAKLKEKNT